MTDTIVFYHNPFSRGRIAHWMLEEVEASYRIEVLNFDTREQKRPDFLAVNPMGKVPAIEHRGTVVTEAAAICAYLADVFPSAGLAPACDEPERGTYLRWLFFGAGCIEPSVIDHILKRSSADAARIVGYGNYQDVLDTLDRALGSGPYLLGERFTAADVYVGSLLGWGLTTLSVEARPSFESYVARCNERPAYQRSFAQCEELGRKLDFG
jgi:glutathione S-transferase